MSTTAVPSSGTQVQAAEMAEALAAGVVQEALAAGVVQEALGMSGVNVSVMAAEVEPQFGLQCSGGQFIDYSAKLDSTDEKTLKEIFAIYATASNNPNFTLNLSALKDGDGNVLTPVDGRDFEADMKVLRDIAQKTLGFENWSWNSYPQGYRAIIGNVKAFATGESERLKNEFDFDVRHLDEWLEHLKADQEYTPDPKDAPELQAQEKQKWDAGKTERVTKAMNASLTRYMAAKSAMDMVTAALDTRINELQEMVKSGNHSPGINARIENLRKLRSRMPVAAKPTDPESAAELRKSGQMTRRASILWAAAHLNEKLDPSQLQKDAQKHLDSFPKPVGDCSGLFTRLKTNHYAELLPENKEAEKNFVNSLALLAIDAPDRRTYEECRVHLDAREFSDGPELFFVQLADAIATKDAAKIAKVMNGSAFEIAFGNSDGINVDPEDRELCRQAVLEASIPTQTALQAIQMPADALTRKAGDIRKSLAAQVNIGPAPVPSAPEKPTVSEKRVAPKLDEKPSKQARTSV
jgi:hypothetical protein